MPIDLYGMPHSAGGRAIMLTAKAVGVEINQKLIDTYKKEHLTPEFLKINPQHTVPTIVDKDFSLWESRAISGYLVNKYAKDDSLYPKDPKKRAVVDQRLYFDMGTLYHRFGDYYGPVIQGLTTEFDSAKLEKLKEALQFLDVFLEGHEYAAGNQLTIADFHLVATVSSMEGVDFDLSPYKNITRWLAKVKTTAAGYKEANEKPLKQFAEFVKEKLPKK